MINNKFVLCNFFPFVLKKHLTIKPMSIEIKTQANSLASNHSLSEKKDIKSKILHYEKKKQENKKNLQNIIFELTSSSKIKKGVIQKTTKSNQENGFYKILYSMSDPEDEQIDDPSDSELISNDHNKIEGFEEKEICINLKTLAAHL